MVNRFNVGHFHVPGDAIEFQDDANEYLDPMDLLLNVITPPYKPAAKATRFPEVPIRTTEWAGTSVKPAIKSTLVPFPFPGVGPAERTDQMIPVGTEGFNTVTLLSVDRSGSMGAPCFPVGTRPLDRSEVAQTLAVMLITVAANQGDHFGICSFDTSAYSEWPQSPPGNLASWTAGLSTDYEAAIKYFRQYTPASATYGYMRPFQPSGGTNQNCALEAILDYMAGSKIKTGTLFVVTDEFADYGNGNHFFRQYMKPYQNSRTGANTGGLPMDEYIRKKGITVYYFGIGSKEQEASGRRAASQLNELLYDHYGTRNMLQPAHWCPLDPSDPDATIKMALLIRDLATRG